MEKSWRNGRRIGRHCQIRLSHARRPWKKRKKGGEGKRRSGRTRNKNGGEKGKDEEEEEEEGGRERRRGRGRRDKGKVSNAVDGTCIRWIAASFENSHGKTPSCSPM